MKRSTYHQVIGSLFCSGNKELAVSATSGYDEVWEKVKSIMRKSGIPNARLTPTTVMNYRAPEQDGYSLKRRTWEKDSIIDIDFHEYTLRKGPNPKFKQWTKKIADELKKNKIKFKIENSGIGLMVIYRKKNK